jgi:hypothetical protein
VSLRADILQTLAAMAPHGEAHGSCEAMVDAPIGRFRD